MKTAGCNHTTVRGTAINRACGNPHPCFVSLVNAATMAAFLAKTSKESRGTVMVKSLFLRHYRSAPEALNNVPTGQWTPEEVDAHMQLMQDSADRLQASGHTSTGRRFQLTAPSYGPRRGLAARNRQTVRGSQEPHRRLDGDRYGRLRSRRRTRPGIVRSPGRRTESAAGMDLGFHKPGWLPWRSGRS